MLESNLEGNWLLGSKFSRDINMYNCLYNIKIVIMYNVYINNSQIVGTRSKGQNVIPFPLMPNNTFGTLD